LAPFAAALRCYTGAAIARLAWPLHFPMAGPADAGTDFRPHGRLLQCSPGMAVNRRPGSGLKSNGGGRTMRKHFFVTAVALVLALAVISLPMAHAQQGQQQEEQTVEGDLKTVDLENATIVVAPEGEAEVTLQITADTVVLDANGEETTVDMLRGKEGSELSAKFVAMEQGNVALSIQFVA
jgi:hypothetical protein